MQRNDGSYYAEGRTVFKAPLREPREDGGADITIGFPVCTASEWVTKEAPQAIADALNAARSPQPDQSELLREAAKVIRGFQGALDDLWCNYLEHAVGGPAAWDEYGAAASGSGLDTLAKIQKELGDD